MTNKYILLISLFIIQSFPAFAAPIKIYTIGSASMTFLKAKTPPASFKLFTSIAVDEAKGVVEGSVSRQRSATEVVVTQFKYNYDPVKKIWFTDVKVQGKVERFPAQLVFDKGQLKSLTVATKAPSPTSKEVYFQKTTSQISATDLKSSVDIYAGDKAVFIQIKANEKIVPESQYLTALKGLKAVPGM